MTLMQQKKSAAGLMAWLKKAEPRFGSRGINTKFLAENGVRLRVKIRKIIYWKKLFEFTLLFLTLLINPIPSR